jgi:hypothetical protein
MCCSRNSGIFQAFTREIGRTSHKTKGINETYPRVHFYEVNFCSESLVTPLDPFALAPRGAVQEMRLGHRVPHNDGRAKPVRVRGGLWTRRALPVQPPGGACPSGAWRMGLSCCWREAPRALIGSYRHPLHSRHRLGPPSCRAACAWRCAAVVTAAAAKPLAGKSAG